MKKILLLWLIFFCCFGVTNAEWEDTPKSSCESTDWWDSHCIVVKTSTPVPGIDCTPASSWLQWKNLVYECKVPKSTKWVMRMVWDIIKYFTFITTVVWVMIITIAWIMYSLWWIDNSMKESAKKWIKQIIFGLIILFLAWRILQLIAPWIFV